MRITRLIYYHKDSPVVRSLIFLATSIDGGDWRPSNFNGRTISPSSRGHSQQIFGKSAFFVSQSRSRIREVGEGERKKNR